MTWYADTDVPYGNAADLAVQDSLGLTRVEFTGHPRGGPEALWFCLRARAEIPPPAGHKLRWVLKNPHNLLGGHPPQNLRPVCRGDGGDWERLGEGTVTELPDGRRSVSWEIEAAATAYDLALCYPYGQPELEALRRDTGTSWQTDTIGVSQAGRPLVRFSNRYGEKDSDCPGLYLLARQHSGETPGSWVLDGFLRRTAELGDAAPLVWAVPLANVDGVEQGDYGKDNFPYDLNRAWGNPAMRHEVLVLKQDVGRWKERCRPVLAIDFHAPGGCEAEGVYAFTRDPAQEPDWAAAVTPWLELFQQALADRYASAKFARVADYASRWETPTTSAFFWKDCGFPGLCLETSYALAGNLVLTREHYREIGARLAQAVSDTLCCSP